MMRIHVTDPMDPADDSGIDQPVLLALAAEATPVAVFAEEVWLGELPTDDLARHRHRRARRSLVSKLRG